MDFEISDSRLIKCIPYYQDEIEDGKRIRIVVQEFEIDIPKGVKTIHKDAFSEVASYVEVIRFAEGPLDLGRERPFRNCKNLREMHFAEGLEEIPWGTLKYCRHLEKVTLPKTLKRIGSEAFKNCIALKEIRIPEETEIIESGASLNCSVPKALTNIDVSAFSHTDIYTYPGMSICFGKYYLDQHGENLSPIIWRQVGEEDGELLFLSDKCLEYMYVDDACAGNSKGPYLYEAPKSKWEDCSMRKRLNTDFLNLAFSDDERAVLRPNNGDYVFLLTYSQFKKINWYGHCMARCSEFALAEKAESQGFWESNTNSEASWPLLDDRNGNYERFDFRSERYFKTEGFVLSSPQNDSDMKNANLIVPAKQKVFVRPAIRIKAGNAERFRIRGC